MLSSYFTLSKLHAHLNSVYFSGHVEAAVKSYRQALILRTDFPEATCNLLHTLQVFFLLFLLFVILVNSCLKSKLLSYLIRWLLIKKNCSILEYVRIIKCVWKCAACIISLDVYGWSTLLKTSVVKAALPAALAARSGKFNTTEPGCIGACRKWRAVKAGRCAVTSSEWRGVNAAASSFFTAKNKEKKWKKTIVFFLRKMNIVLLITDQ